MNSIQEDEIKEMLEIGRHVAKQKWNISHFESLKLAAHIQTNLYLKKIAKALDEPVEIPQVPNEPVPMP